SARCWTPDDITVGVFAATSDALSTATTHAKRRAVSSVTPASLPTLGGLFPAGPRHIRDDERFDDVKRRPVPTGHADGLRQRGFRAIGECPATRLPPNWFVYCLSSNRADFTSAAHARPAAAA